MREILKKDLLCLVVISLIIATLVKPELASANACIGNNIEIENIFGMCCDDALKNDITIETTEDFNCKLKSLELTVNNSSAKLETELEGKSIVFCPQLHKSQLGYNSENAVFGISSEISGNFKLRKFLIEKNVSDMSLLQPNKNMLHHTVASVALYSIDTNKVYYFQFVCDGIDLPLDMEAESDMAIYELANYGARAYDEVECEYTAMEDSAVNEISIEFGDEAARQETDDKLINACMSNTEDYVPVVSEDSRIIDGIIAQCQYGPIDLNQRSLVANIPDSVYKVHTEGWSKSTGAYVQEGANAKRCNGYYVYHMPDVMSKNVLNYAMRFENLVNYNYSSQTFICSFIITNNIWVQYIQSDNKVYIFDDRDSNARITVKGTSYLKSGTANGYFTHFEESSIVQASRQARITKGVLGTVPKLGTAIDIAERAFSDTELRTGAKHPASQYTKKLSATMKGMKHKKDHITITGYGSGVKQISFGFECVCSAS